MTKRAHLRINEVAAQLGVTTQSVRRYVNSGALQSDHTPQGQRIFKQEYVDAFTGIKPATTPEKKFAHYVRSSNGNKELLQSQINQLTEAFGESEQTYIDKCSGLKSDRQGLTRLLDDARDGRMTHVAVTQKDRLARFGVELIERLLNDYGVTLIVLHETGDKSLQEELMQDFMSLIASFSGKFYRIRGYEQKKLLLDEAHKRLE